MRENKFPFIVMKSIQIKFINKNYLTKSNYIKDTKLIIIIMIKKTIQLNQKQIEIAKQIP